MSATDPNPPPVESSQQRSTGAVQNRSTTSRCRQPRNITNNPTNYSGQCEDISCLLSLRSERFDKKVHFQVFMEKMANYVISNLKDGGDIQCIFHELKDPTENFLLTHKTVKPPQDEFGGIDEVDKEIYKEEVKQFVQRKINLRRNIEKSYGLIWGQYSSGLKQYVKGLESYSVNSKSFDTIWLLKELKKATAGIDDQANAHINMH